MRTPARRFRRNGDLGKPQALLGDRAAKQFARETQHLASTDDNRLQHVPSRRTLIEGDELTTPARHKPLKAFWESIMFKISLAPFAVLAALAGASQAEAAPLRDAGTLTCHVAPGMGLVVGSVRQVECTHTFYNQAGRRFVENYVGTMRRTGFDVGLTSDQMVTWAVSTHMRRGSFSMLSGLFAGASADASVVVGAGTQAMVAEMQRDLFLEPVSGSGQVGIGVGFGATGLELQRVPGSAYTSLR